MRDSYCYLLYCGNRTYIGATYNPHVRLEQHNGIRSGGARATHGKQWTLALYISGFPDWNNTLSFEWAWKRESRKNPGVYGKIGGLARLIRKRASTSQAIPFAYWTSRISMYISPHFNQISKKIEEFRNIKSLFVPTANNTSFLAFLFPSFSLSFLSDTMSIPSDALTVLAQKYEEMSLEVALLKNQIKTIQERVDAPKEKKPRKPRAAKVAVPAAADGTESKPAAEVSSSEPIKEKKPRKPRAAKVAEPAAADGTESKPAAEVSSSEPIKEKKPRKPRAAKVAEPAAADGTESKPAAEVSSVPIKEKKPRKPKAAKVAEPAADSAAATAAATAAESAADSTPTA
jgi:predicted GIY-YIG superfamily endonuclease